MPVTDKVVIHLEAKDRASPIIRRVTGEIKQLEMGVSSGRLAFGHLTTSMYNVGTGAERFGFTVNKVDTGFNRFTENITDASTEMGGFSSAADSGISKLIPFAAAILAAVGSLVVLKKILTATTQALKDFIVDGIKAASAFEQMEVRLSVLLDSEEQGEKALEWIKEFTKTTPYRLEEVADAFALLTAFEIDATDKLRMLGDVAAGVDKPLTQVIEAFNKLTVGRTGEAIESLELLGLAVRKIPELEFDARGALITPLEEAIPLIEELMVEKFGGSMEAMAETAAGGWVIILDLITQIKAAVGDFLLPMIEDVQKELIGLFEVILERGGEITGFWANVLAPILEFSVIKPIIGGINAIKTFLIYSAQWYESFTAALQPMIKLLDEFVFAQLKLGEGAGVYSDIAEGFGIVARAILMAYEPLRIFSELLYSILTTPIWDWGAAIATAKAELEELGKFVMTGIKAGQKAPWGLEFDIPGWPGPPVGGTEEEKQAALLGLDEFELRRREYEEKRREEAYDRAIEDAKKLADVAKEYGEETAEAYSKSFRKVLEVDLLKGSGKAIRDGVKAGFGAAIFEGESFWSAFADVGKRYLQRMFNTVFDFAMNILGELLSGLFGGQGGGLISTIAGFLGGIFGFQHGAVVEGSKRGVPAMVGENFTPEIVGPLNLEGFGFYMSEALRRIPEAFEAARAMFTPAQYEMSPVVILEGVHFGDYELYHATERGRVLAGRIEGPI